MNATPQALPAKGTTGVTYNSDKFSMLPRDQVQRAAFEVLSAVQKEPIELQVASIASAFAAYCTKLNLSAHEMYQLARRLNKRQPHHVQANDQSDALTDFIGAKAEGRF